MVNSDNILPTDTEKGLGSSSSSNDTSFIALSVPLANYRGRAVYNETFDTLNYTATNCSVTADTTNYLSGIQSAVLLTTGSSVWWYITKSGLSLDLTGCSGFVRLYIQASSGTSVYTSITNIWINLTDSNGYVRQYKICTNGRLGWTEVDFCLEECTADGAPSKGTFNYAHITQISYNIMVSAAGKVPVVNFDQLMFYKPRNKVPLIWFRSDAGYIRQYNFASYLRSLPLTGANVKSSSPSLHIAVPGIFFTSPGGDTMTITQLQNLVNAGHYVGIYGQGEDGNMWIGKTDAQKLDNIASGINGILNNGLPRPKFLAISGSSGWRDSDDTNYLGKYFNVVCGMNDFAGNRFVHPVACKYAFTSVFTPDSSALVTPTVTVDISKNVIILGTIQKWTCVHPVKFSTTGTLPAGLTAGKIYWLQMTTATGGALYSTALDAMNSTNAITFSDRGSGTLIVISIDDEYFGARVYALLKNNGLWTQGCHCNSNTDLANAKFEADALASIVNAGQAQFVNIDEILSGIGIV